MSNPINCTAADLASFISSLARAAESSPTTSSDSEPSAPSSSTRSVSGCSKPGRPTGHSNGSPPSVMSVNSMGDRGEGSLTSSQVVSRAPIFPQQGAAQASKAHSPASGLSSPGSFVRFDPGSSTWKTPQPSLLGDSDEFSGTWPRSGTMRNGACWERATLAPITGATGFGSLPTPLATDGTNGGPNQRGGKGDLRLSSAVQLPTPQAYSQGQSASPPGLTPLDLAVRPEMARHAARAKDRRAGMLPTPTATDATGGPGVALTAQGGLNLRTAVAMLPTPTATQYGTNRGGANPDGPERASLDTMARRGALLPTPTVDGNYNRKGASAKSGDGLHTALMLATPTARDWRSGKASQETMDRNSRPLSEQIGGLLNPEFVERMMGWPRHWTRTNGATGESGVSPPPSANCPTAPIGSSVSETVKSRSARPKRGGNLSPAGDGDG